MSGYVEHFEDLRGVTDSMLLPSELVIARYKDPEEDIYLSLEVRGDVKIEYKGSCYIDVSQFPKELKEIIKNGYIQTDTQGREHKEPYYHHPDISVYENNWFEVFVEDRNGNYLGDSVVVDAEDSTHKDIEILLGNIADEIIKDRDNEYEY